MFIKEVVGDLDGYDFLAIDSLLSLDFTKSTLYFVDYGLFTSINNSAMKTFTLQSPFDSNTEEKSKRSFGH